MGKPAMKAILMHSGLVFRQLRTAGAIRQCVGRQYRAVVLALVAIEMLFVSNIQCKASKE